MGVYIKGMEMPQNGARFRVVEDIEGNKFFTSADWMDGIYYPLVEVEAPHGRLIDADELTFDVYARKNYHVNTYAYSEEKINNAQTVIEAEE